MYICQSQSPSSSHHHSPSLGNHKFKSWTRTWKSSTSTPDTYELSGHQEASHQEETYISVTDQSQIVIMWSSGVAVSMGQFPSLCSLSSGYTQAADSQMLVNGPGAGGKRREWISQNPSPSLKIMPVMLCLCICKLELKRTSCRCVLTGRASLQENLLIFQNFKCTYP